MAITVDWNTLIISIPKADTQLVSAGPPEIRQLDLDQFRQDLNDIEETVDGAAFLDNHSHVPPITVGGVTLARVVEIINGYTITFEDGQYAVNLVGANSNIGDVTNVNQVSIRSANSAGLTFSEQINAQSFTDDVVSIDTIDGLPGTSFPRGTPTDPVDNLADAYTIALAQKLRGFSLRGAISLDRDYEGYRFKGTIGKATAVITLNSYSVNNSSFNLVTITGIGSGNLFAAQIKILALTGVSGTFKNCGLENFVLPALTVQTELIHCYSTIAGTNQPYIDLQAGTGPELIVRDYWGGLEIRNVDQSAQDVSVDLGAGSLTIASSCTAGTIVVRGVGTLTNNSAGATVVTTGFIDGSIIQQILKKVKFIITNLFK
jgi:hypothetical protein